VWAACGGSLGEPRRGLSSITHHPSNPHPTLSQASDDLLASEVSSGRRRRGALGARRQQRLEPLPTPRPCITSAARHAAPTALILLPLVPLPADARQVVTAPYDPRFPATNQARHCFVRYNEYYKWAPGGGERGAGACFSWGEWGAPHGNEGTWLAAQNAWLHGASGRHFQRAFPAALSPPPAARQVRVRARR
jgi:hypothetical protein